MCVFLCKAFKLLCALRTEHATDKQYESRRKIAVGRKFEIISEEIGKIKGATQVVHILNSSENTSDQKIFMAVAIQLKKKVVSYKENYSGSNNGYIIVPKRLSTCPV